MHITSDNFLSGSNRIKNVPPLGAHRRGGVNEKINFGLEAGYKDLEDDVVDTI